MSKIYLHASDVNYPLILDFLKRSPKELLHKVENDHVIKLLKSGHEKVLTRIRPGSSRLIVEFLNGDPSTEATRAVKQYITEWLDLETDLSAFYRMAARDEMLKPVVKRFRGYRIVGQPDLFESLVWAIIGQQINLQFAYTLKSRFVEKFGERLHWNNESFYLFPDPKLVSQLTDDVLIGMQFSRQKSKYIIGLAEVFAAGALSREKIKALSFEDAKQTLMKIKGIGNWTANYALMKTFRYPNAFPLEDAGLHNAIRNLMKMDRKPTLDEVRKIFRKYKGWEAYATLYLWKTL
ncbi:MAG TPA: DNA-3-methyladenine glycosylase [Chryseosolibacter sp.]|nr:DNA-3-methyladenine glycosylase [Chryseosolibacter sp.]